MVYRTDDCKGVGIKCGRTDGGRKNPSGGSSEVEPAPSKHQVEGSIPSPRSKSRLEPAVDQQEPPSRPVAKSGKSLVASKTTKGMPRPSRAKASKAKPAEAGPKPDGDASRPSQQGGGAGRAATAAPSAPARPSRGQALSQDSVGALSPDGPVDASAQAKRGRPRIHADRAAYRAQKAREYRARDKVERASK